MPQRAMHLAMALAGVMAVAGLLAAGIDPERASGRGPRWRRLIAAGIALLVAIGIWTVVSGRAMEWVRDIWASPTCYDRAAIEIQPPTVERLEQRLDQLKVSAEAGRLDPAVVRRTTASIVRDIDELDLELSAAPMTSPERQRAQKVRQDAKEMLRRLTDQAAGE
jgi:hypothetical protein